MKAEQMTEAQRKLARHALGLGGRWKRSYRNRYVIGLGMKATDYPDWQAMVAAGWAAFEYGSFRMTRAGAELALEPGETLCPEDFPPEIEEQTP